MLSYFEKYKIKRDLIILFSVIIIVIIWQIIFISNFPDADTDAYAHHIISRDIIRNPLNLSIHWVWLPFFHYLGVLYILLDLGLQSIRVTNIFIWSAIPILIFFHLKAKEINSNIPLYASLITAIFPLGIIMGTTGQPEPLFTLITLLFIIFFDKEKYFISSTSLLILCSLRYEGWAILGFITIYILFFKLKYNKIIYLNIIFPLLFIVIWTYLRFISDGELFSFLKGTSKFAQDAMDVNKNIDRNFISYFKDIFWYFFWVPFIFSGITILLIPFGFKKFIKENNILCITSTGILFFITITWVLKSNLGLNRHFTSLIPFYSIMIAYGIESLVLYFKNKFLNKIYYIIPSTTFLIILFYTIMWLSIWKNINNNEFEEKFPLAEFLKTLPVENEIICNDPMVEIFSKLDYKRFNHHWIEDNNETKYFLRSKNGSIIIANELKLKYISEKYTILFESIRNEKTNNKIFVLKLL